MKRLLLIFILILLPISIVLSGDRIDLKDSQIKLITKLQDQGLLSINPELNEAYIDSNLWGKMKYQVKENFAASLAIYCGNEKGTQLYWVNIYDQYSGKKIGKYSQSWGFTVY